MANDLANLSSQLAQQLRDTTHDVWNSTEKDNLIVWAVASLFPRYSRYLDPSDAAQEVTLVADTYWYALPAGMLEVSTVDLIDTQGNELGALDGQAWQITGDPYSGSSMLRISPRITNDLGGTVRLHGYARYDTTTNLIPDDFVPLVLAKARAEAYKRMGPERAQFENWQARNQRQNTSINELMALITEAEATAIRLQRSTPKVWRRPVPGRLG